MWHEKTGSTDDRLSDDEVTDSSRPVSPVFIFIRYYSTDRMAGYGPFSL